MAAVVTAAAMVVTGVTLAALPHGGGARPASGVLPPGSMGSLASHHSWWDPRGWVGGDRQPPKPRTIHVVGRPARARRPHRAVAVAPKPRRVRELAGRRTANTRVYELSDGRLQADVSAAPVNYRDAAGRWRPIDAHVRRSARPGYRYASTSNFFGSFFGADPARLVRLQAPGGGWLQMGVDGMHAARLRAAGNTVTYPGVAPGAGLSYRVTPTGLTEDITLASASAASSFSFTVTVGGGLVPYRRAGQVVFSRTGAGGPAVLVMPRPFMTDSRRDRWSPAGVAWSPRVSQRLRWDPGSGTLRVTLTPDARWLHQKGRRFPVVIDPTINVAPPPGQAQSTVISADTPNTAYPASSWPLQAGTTPTGAVRSLLLFPLPDSIPPNTLIDSATLRLYRDQEFGSTPAAQTIEVHQANAAWDPATATWSTASGLAGTLAGQAVVNPSPVNVWDSFPITSTVQAWLNAPTSNDGLVVKTANEAALGKGGPQYQRSVTGYGGATATNPQLVITYGRPAVVLNQITTIRGDGADLSWAPYTDPTPGTNPGDDLVEYQVHRTTRQAYKPTNANLVAPVPAGTTSYSDTSATPGSVVYYMVTAKTVGGIGPSATQRVVLPAAGFTTQVIDASGATTLSAAQPGTAEQHLTGQPWLAVGDNSATYGVTRTVVNFPSLASQNIPATAVVTGAQLQLWGFSNANTGGGPASYEAHALTQDFDPATATWNSASAGTPWATAGGAFSPGTDGPSPGLTSQPAADQLQVTSAVKGWLSNAASQHGFLVKLAAETSGSPQEQELFLDTTAAEPALRPELLVTYLNATPEDTYYVPGVPDDMTSGTTYTVPVTVTNTTGVTLPASTWKLSYHWFLPDDQTDVGDASNELQTSLPADLAPGASVTVNAQLKTPDITTGTQAGNIRAAYTLGWDLYNTGATPPWLSTNTQGVQQIAPLTQDVSVTKPGPALLGLEKYYQYTTMATGAGSALLSNDATGNVVWSYNAFSNPSAGFATFVRLAYNSMDTSSSSMGFGWSLQASTLMRLGSPLDFHPNPQNNSATATLTDGDGTTHTFTRADATSPWVSPPGFHYFLQQVPNTCDPSGHADDNPAWTLTRPDRTQIWFDCQGYQSAVIDRNGNETDFTYEDRANSYNKPVKFLDYITDQAGRQTLTISYYRKGDATWSYYDPSSGTVKTGTGKLTNPKIEDQVKSITDISGRTITFYYTTQGLLGQMTDGDGTPQLTKVFTFGYDMTQGNKNVKLVSVTDPRGNTTQLAYYQAPTDPTFKWSLQTLTDRRANSVTFAYAQSTDPVNPGGINTAVTDQAGQNGQTGHTTNYQMDASGRPVQITDAKSQKTQLGWDSDNNVTSLTEDNGAKTTWTWDNNTGYPLTMTGAQANHDGTAGTTYTYNFGLNGHIADLASILTPQQRLWTFGYDTNGNLTSVTDPDGNAPGATPGSYTTHYTYDNPQLGTGQTLFGVLHTAQNANGNTTTYTNYDPNGYPQTITDPPPLSGAWTYTYDARGNVKTSADPFNDTTSYSYDVFGRPGQVVVPKDHNATPPVMITIPAPVYDGNDNVKKSFDATGAETDYTQNANDQLANKTLPSDDTAGTVRKYTYTYDSRGNLKTVTEPNGNTPGATPGSYTTSYGYDNINELTSVTDAAGDPPTIYGYDDVGNRTSVTDPLNHLTQQAYNLNHQPTIATDAQNNTTITHYDLDGLVDKVTDQNNNTTEYTRDPRGDVIQVKAPHDPAGTVPGEAAYNYTQYVYDQAGNRTQVLTPRAIANGYSRSSACITTQTCGYTYVTRYDPGNRVSAQLSAYDPTAGGSTPAETDYTYNAAGQLTQVTAPPSGTPASGGPNITTFRYWDNNWVKSSTDPWNITTSYDYADNGLQKARTITSADGSMSRTQSWLYWPGGQLETLQDNGGPAGAAAELVDNSDFNNANPSGTWAKATTGTGYVGYDYRTHAKATGSDTFTWKVHVPADGQYKVDVKYPVISGAATSALFTVNYQDGGSATVPVNQTANTGPGGWVNLGQFGFKQAGTGQQITLPQSSTGKVVADAVRLVRVTTGASDPLHSFTYGYDATGNQTSIADNSTPAPTITNYAMGYDPVNRLTEVDEKDSTGAVKHKTTYAYDAASNLKIRIHDGAESDFAYDPRNLLAQQTDKASPSDTTPQITQFTQYTPDGLLKKETKPNGNTVTYAYFADQLLQQQLEKTPAGAIVAEHDYGYNPDGAKNSDHEQLMNADPGQPPLTHTLAYSYDPRDRITKVTKDGATAEQYTHDANDNVTSQTIGTSPTTSFSYDRDRILTATTGGSAVSYNYDSFGRLDTITNPAGNPLEQNTYDGFDNITAHTQGGTTTSYTYDPLNRETSQTVGGGTATQYSYLGLSGELTGETNTTSGLNKAYAYTPGGQRLFQYTPGTTAANLGYYSYNDHNDVEAVTGTSGGTTATYGYTAYGQPDPGQFTGTDKNNLNPGPAVQPYNSYRFNAMRWDANSGQYNMGFRNYAPGLNQFLTRDMYNGALADMQLTTDPFTGNRYTFAAGNPITNIELDGHSFPGGGGAAGCPYGTIGCLGGPPVTSGSGGSSSSQCSGFMPNCNNPCIKYANLCKPSGTQLNEGTQPVQRNPSIWNMLPGACDAGFMLLPCHSLAATGEGGGSSNEGSGSSFGGIRDFFDWLLGLGSQAAARAAERAALRAAIADGRVAADAPLGHLNGAIAEELGWQDAISNGEIGIQGPGKVTAPGPDFITYNSETDRITLWDATAGKTPKQLPVPEYWMPEARAAVASYTGPYAAEIQQALTNGQVVTNIFRYIPQG